MLTLQFVPYSEIEYLSSVGRIRKLLNITKENRIVLLQGRLRKEEETELIKATMEEIDKDFKGIELSVIYPDKKENDLFRKIKRNFVNMLLGDRQGLTIIGPASVVREIKKDPDKIQLFTEEDSKIKKRRKI
ncbi:hypothetical protein COY26_04820 [Candidatus Woesearchaeota archaeon CG_4_10_14_0_2_um_filter_33_10]|nr:MAG: hypothetical protein AUJ83_01745 [Candidatus Woesearchaeota archaeon CG1_02_33_12]PIN78729.1 MAG: hypothetical protein COV14_02230 [Candidatus Woesearchaeota archaeon CG10_big_fil_rev_8_21_14_0_10_33_12]PIZ52297.1 MAG: hypothetical protein COY26_04820 [Candidatus Woesearchaeota archaeon CG_4_10_14_0_2_um_filter_33_10]